ncbi:hypothetical protein TEA_024497 [Camellia sinensis var. sinensis]|uniref:Peptidase M16 C-terminal domain-containing protein n=1 Tax=Camellia sinensis var. sinensis TaxID=542762 RepID=A0A4V6RY12_CAMSN|nr:hypothetical protein TEA_024497 [Camellia sinensis var. sinensis]
MISSSPKSFVIPAPSEPGKIQLYSPQYYAACTVGGILSCGLTHMAVTLFFLIYLAGSASAEVIADVALCSFEVVKVRVQTQPGFARGLSDGFPKFIQSAGTLGLYKGIAPLWGPPPRGPTRWGVNVGSGNLSHIGSLETLDPPYKHGGSTNAFTSSERTNYYFDVISDSFEEALDRFAQFFIKPLMSADATTREIKAVDSDVCIFDKEQDDDQCVFPFDASTSEKLEYEEVNGYSYEEESVCDEVVVHRVDDVSIFDSYDDDGDDLLVDGGNDIGDEAYDNDGWGSSWLCSYLASHGKSGCNATFQGSYGNWDTLEVKPKARGVDTRHELLKLYEENYSANLMHLVVYGKESVDKIQSLVESKFQEIRNIDRSYPCFPGHPCTSEHLQVLIKAVPIKQGHQLRIIWPLTPGIRHHKEGPSKYLGHLIGHEGEGSVFYILKTLGWATSLSAGESDWTYEFSFFKVAIDLTDAGHEHVEDIVALVFKYIQLLQQSGPCKWIFDEVFTGNLSLELNWCTFLALFMQ